MGRHSVDDEYARKGIVMIFERKTLTSNYVLLAIQHLRNRRKHVDVRSLSKYLGYPAAAVKWRLNKLIDTGHVLHEKYKTADYAIARKEIIWPVQ